MTQRPPVARTRVLTEESSKSSREEGFASRCGCLLARGFFPIPRRRSKVRAPIPLEQAGPRGPRLLTFYLVGGALEQLASCSLVQGGAELASSPRSVAEEGGETSDY